MNALAQMWAQREAERLQRIELRILVNELRESQAAIAPLMAKANEIRKSNMRQDGPNGFRMVMK